MDTRNFVSSYQFAVYVVFMSPNANLELTISKPRVLKSFKGMRVNSPYSWKNNICKIFSNQLRCFILSSNAIALPRMRTLMITITTLLWRSLGVMQEGLDLMNWVEFLTRKARDVGMAWK